MDTLPQGLPKISDIQLQDLKQYERVLLEYNAKINLMSRKETNHIFDRHILHSLSIAHYFKFTDASRIADVGSGGGFPGIPLAIYFRNVEFTLIESIRKKAQALREMAEQIGLNNIRVVNLRAEQCNEKFDFVTGRAVTALPDFYRFTAHLISGRQQNAVPNGIIYLKGGNFSEEIQTFPSAEIFDLSILTSDDYFETKHIVYLPVRGKNK